MLLYRGASSVVSSSRISWGSLADPGGIPYHFYYRLLQDTIISSGVIGIAYDIARNDFMGNTGFWLPAYHYNLFGDPALRQFGQTVGIEGNEFSTKSPSVFLYPNPSRGIIKLETRTQQYVDTEFGFYDVSGRLVRTVKVGASQGEYFSLNIELPAGVYFMRCRDDRYDLQEKIVVSK